MSTSMWHVRAGSAGMTAFLFGTGLLVQGQDPAAGGLVEAVKGAKEKQETCRIAGMVVKLADGTPLKNATVRLENGEDREHTIAVKTTADGRYELRNVPSGRYKVKVTRNGYVEAEYGQRKPSDPGGTLALAPGENKEPVNFKLIPAAVIAGRIFDEDGEPMPHAVVLASRETYHEGGKTLLSVTADRTNDLGQFRLFGLAPGRYFVSAVQNDGREVPGEREFIGGEKQGEKGYIKTYYPGTQDVAKASTITVKEGEEVPGVDMQLKQVSVYRIRGRVFNQITHKGGSNAYLQLVSRSKRLEWDFGGGQEVLKPDGTFEFPNVAPGSYLLMAYWEDQGKFYSTQEKIDIGESDLEGVSLVIGSGATIPGHIRWEGKPSLERDELSVAIQPAETPSWQGAAHVEANQQFTLKDVGDGDYKVVVNGFGKDCYIQDTLYGETHSAEGVISVGKGRGEHLEITISSRGAHVEGAVVDENGLPAAGVWVVAVPEEAKRTNFRLFKAQTTDQYGKFDLRGLAPGTYKLFSWAGIKNNAWEDGDFLKLFEEKGELVELAEGDVKTANLKAIETKGDQAE